METKRLTKEQLVDYCKKENLTNAELCMVNELLDYKDIEQELGIDLTILFKLTKATNVYAYGHNGIIKCDLIGVNFENVFMWNGTTSMCYPLCEYRKSFALTREELENEH